MRDLAARLRAIVGTDRNRLRESCPRHDPSATPGLTYEADLSAPPADGARVAELLGGVLGGTSCIVIDRTWDPYQWHGRRQVEAYAMDPAAPITLFDPRLAPEVDWASRMVFFDVETTGLSGGAGTLAFLAGCGWFENGGFRVRQFFLSGPAGEHAMLDGLAAIFDAASLLVTFNGRSFDVPLMETRWAYHRRECPTAELPHFDMLPPARLLWSRREDERTSCTLSALERSVLRFHRAGDVPGFEIPSRYFRFLRTGDSSVIQGVLEHNQHDLISLAAVMAHALQLARVGADDCETPGEQLALGRLYERAGDRARAGYAYELAAASGDREVGTHALERLARLLRREARHEEAADAWQRLLDRAPRGRPLSSLERRAAEALAIHHEHRRRDLGSARRYAQSLRTVATGRLAADVDHRLGRIDRKMKERGGGLAASLLESPPEESESSTAAGRASGGGAPRAGER